GAVRWTREFGTSQQDEALSVAIGDGDLFVGGVAQGALPGQTFVGADEDAFVRAFTSSGTRLWTSEFGASNGDAYASQVSVNASGIAVGGDVLFAALPGQTFKGGSDDGFVREYAIGGSVMWTREFGTTGN